MAMYMHACLNFETTFQIDLLNMEYFYLYDI